jgi:hypothetical protein
MRAATFKAATAAVLRVGDGRGFIINVWGENRVVAAAHCLPSLPPPHGFSYRHERTYRDLLGPLGGAPQVSAECLFVDPVADIALLGQPDYQDLPKQADAYDALTADVTPLVIGQLEHPLRTTGFLLTLDGAWFACTVERLPRDLSITNATEGIRGGMSGSPILDAAGRAIGVVCLSGGRNETDVHTEGVPNPYLAACLPHWVFENQPDPFAAAIRDGHITEAERDALIKGGDG